MRKNAFTLAEVLITLGIIGVIAALTLPTLTANTQNAKIGPKLAKAASVFEQGNEALLSHESVDSLTEGDLVSSAGSYCNNLLDFMKGYCEDATLTLVDGVSYTIEFDNNPSGSGMPHRRKIGQVDIDINGASNPNQPAEDVFYFALYDDGSLRPKGGKNWDESGSDTSTWKTQCREDEEPAANGGAEYCAGHIFEHNLKVLYK